MPIDDDTRARARKWAAAQTAAPAKPRIVTKKQLADSGLSLRDYMNKQQGLTRRRERDPTAGEARDRDAQIAADAIDPGSSHIPLTAPQQVMEDELQRRERNRAKVGELANLRHGNVALEKEIAGIKRSTPAVVRDSPERVAAMERMRRMVEVEPEPTFRRGGSVKKAAASRGNGIAQRGKRFGNMY